MKLWHKLRASIINRKIRRERREMAKYLRRSAYEISAWRQDISFLQEQLDQHLTLAGKAPPTAAVVPEPDNIISITDAIPPRATAGR